MSTIWIRERCDVDLLKEAFPGVRRVSPDLDRGVFKAFSIASYWEKDIQYCLIETGIIEASFDPDQIPS